MDLNTAREPELLVPAGNMEKLETAVLYGADAVYLGGNALNLRTGAGFDDSNLEKAFTYARNHGVKAYYLLNAYPREPQLRHVETQLDMLQKLHALGRGPDGVIAADPGVIRRLRKRLPELPLHVSTQANTMNSEAALFWRDQGARRVNLAREMRSEELKELLAVCRRLDPPLEVEIFIHGAQCMALSGRCYMSAYLNDRPGNSGQCSHPCRYDYRVTGLRVEEETRKGRPMWELEERDDGVGEQFTQFFAAEDLCLLHYLDWMRRMGVCALKIEGRNKSSAYLAQVTDAYASALRHLREGQSRFHPETYLAELVNTASRPLSRGFFDESEHAALAQPPAAEYARPVLARIEADLGNGRWRVEVKHRWDVLGFAVEMLVPGLERPGLAVEEFGLENEQGEALSVVHPGQKALLHCDRPELRKGMFFRKAWTFDL
ncbi:putative protease [Paucidesulfovibrio gracilis DSM 16080]|uniref:Putative protease n=1 Tax=Paucidesulfovibrio gracilis DSM 16080 TaxID=1121449 RepID=A0A1T4Y513_9BACT|nr:peptidase U32 family protein [Paucidesulfovibrio gracilis]SKA96820.1 putative protease [Paucidesulfovibrio gracilis DSM 16080]